MSKIAIIGAGSFGTALAVALAAQDQQGGTGLRFMGARCRADGTDGTGA